ncbi:hypothetical protein O3M35_003861 [Rhynocoris fuscipes]|uniref:Uncharacterized protein n=1 Tax=Rhynocoris fuscipes TaxID=488301 RepID=A0AAW1CKE8_9HEMI
MNETINFCSDNKNLDEKLNTDNLKINNNEKTVFDDNWEDEKNYILEKINNTYDNENNIKNENKLFVTNEIQKIFPIEVHKLEDFDNVNLKDDTSIKVVKCEKRYSNNINVPFPVLSRKILSWPSASWEDGPRRSAFQPYKPATVLTNLQRGNIQTQTAQLDVTQFTLHTKAGRGDLRVEDILNVQDINEKDDYGMTALMWSAAYGQTITVQRLLKRGSNPKLCGNCQQTALHMAAFGGHHEIIKLLIAYGADVNAIDGQGNTPIMYAIFEDHPHAVHELLLGDADLTINNFNNIMPYKLAIERNCSQGKFVL